MTFEDADIEYDVNDENTFVVKNLNFKLAKGDKLAITGESQSGKTSILYAVM